MRFHEIRVHVGSSPQGRYCTIEVARFSVRHSDNHIGLVVFGVNGQSSFCSKNCIMILTQVEMKQANVVPGTMMAHGHSAWPMCASTPEYGGMGNGVGFATTRSSFSWAEVLIPFTLHLFPTVFPLAVERIVAHRIRTRAGVVNFNHTPKHHVLFRLRHTKLCPIAPPCPNPKPRAPIMERKVQSN
jgi:hypothetical protein